jgi:hypothetical protein
MGSLHTKEATKPPAKSAEQQVMIADFNRKIKIAKTQHSFEGVFCEEFDKQHMTQDRFSELSGLSIQTCKNNRNGKGSPSLENVIASCIALSVCGADAEYWLALAGYTLNGTPKQIAYKVVISTVMTIIECNEMLSYFNVEQLPTKVSR